MVEEALQRAGAAQCPPPCSTYVRLMPARCPPTVRPVSALYPRQEPEPTKETLDSVLPPDENGFPGRDPATSQHQPGPRPQYPPPTPAHGCSSVPNPDQHISLP